MEEEHPQLDASYLPFILISSVYILLAAITDLSVLGFLPDYGFVRYMPVAIALMMAGIIASCLRLKFNVPVVLLLFIEVILFSPSLFLLIHRLFTGTYNFEFLKTIFNNS